MRSSIDKTSSAELSEAVNSMFRWYQNADICYAYLSDVPTLNSVCDPCWGGIFDVKRVFHHSRWFTRGWTLQELIAPAIVVFYAQDWSRLGSKALLYRQLAFITGIDKNVLKGAPLTTCNVAERMSWASWRQTTRTEDRAYSLLGIFHVSMPLIYSEGNRAFIRLQEEIMKVYEDYTILSWPSFAASTDLESSEKVRNDRYCSALAEDPNRFKPNSGSDWKYSDLIPNEEDWLRIKRITIDSDVVTMSDPPALTARGLRIHLPVMHLDDHSILGYIFLKQKTTGFHVCLKLRRITSKSHVYERERSEANGFQFVRDRELQEFNYYTFFIQLLYPVPESELEQPPKAEVRIEMVNNEMLGDRSLKYSMYSSAEEKFREAMRFGRILDFDKSDNADGLYFLKCVDKLVSALRFQQKYVEAEELQTMIIERSEKLLENDDGLTLLRKVDLGVMLSEQNRIEEAEELLVKVFDISSKLYGLRSLASVKSLGYLIDLDIRHGDQGHLDKARVKFIQYLRGVHQLLGGKLAQNHNGFQYTDWTNRNVYKWEKWLLEQASTLCKSILGDRDQDTLHFTWCLAAYYWHNDEQTRAQELGEQVLKAGSAVLSANHADTLYRVFIVKYWKNENDKARRERGELD
jgi:Tetratricopeptide repeat